MADAMSYLYEVIAKCLADDDAPTAAEVAGRVLARAKSDGRLAEVLAASSLRWISQDVRWYMAADRKRGLQRRHPGVMPEGDETEDAAPRGLLATYWNVPDGSHLRLADMHAVDLDASAVGYEDRAGKNLARAMFLRALSLKVGDQTVGEALTEEQVESLADQYMRPAVDGSEDDVSDEEESPDAST